MEIFITILVLLLFIVYMVFACSLYIRRWHDLGYSGWMALIQLIPLVNLVVLVYLFCARGDERPNVYGQSNVGKPFLRSLFNPKSLRESPESIPAAPVIPPSSSV